jgi:hypothetical protein
VIGLALRRSRAGKSPLGMWTASFILVCLTSLCLGVSGWMPGGIGTEEYWLTWLGNRILETHTIPHALGAESPLDIGRPWIAQEWLSAVIFAVMQAHRLFVPFAIVLGLAWSTLPWITLAECIRARIGPSMTFLIVLQTTLVASLRFTVRAEDLAIGMLAAVYVVSSHRDRRWLWLILPLLAIWANLHASFFIGVALAGYVVVRRRNWPGVAIVVGGLFATLLTPFGASLWMYALWLPHSWVHAYIAEWRSAWETLPSEIPGLFLPIVVIGYRAQWRRGALGGAALWLSLVAATLEMTRWGPLASTFGVPAGAGTARMRDPAEPRIGNATLAIALPLIALLFTHTSWLGSGVRVDPVFGLIKRARGPEFVVTAATFANRLTWCAESADCAVVLYYGGKTLLDPRVDPFPAARVALFATSKTAILCYPMIERIISPLPLAPERIGHDWTIEHVNADVIYRRDPTHLAQTAPRICGIDTPTKRSLHGTLE